MDANRKFQTIGLLIMFALMIASKCLGQDSGYKSEHPHYVDFMPINKDGKLVAQHVVDVGEETAAQLYSKAKLFISENYNSSQAVIDISDDVNNTIIAKPMREVMVFTGIAEQLLYLYYTIKIECKDGRYRLTVYDVYFQNPPPYSNYRHNVEEVLLNNKYYKNWQKKTPNKVAQAQADAVLELLLDMRVKLYTALSSPMQSDDW